MTIITREVPFDPQGSDDGLTLDGYAAVFNTPTRIDSWEGRFDEQIAPGAFRKTLAESTPVLQFDHGHHPMVGSIPIGSFRSLEEDEQGLRVIGDVFDNWLTLPVRDAIKGQAIKGMSFRFEVVKEKKTAQDSGVELRTITEVKLHEAGPVVWPAYKTTSVSLRHLIPETEEERAALLRALLFDTPIVGEPRAALDPDTEPSAMPEPTDVTRGLTPNQRLRCLQLLAA